MNCGSAHHVSVDMIQRSSQLERVEQCVLVSNWIGTTTMTRAPLDTCVSCVVVVLAFKLKLDVNS